MISAFFLFQACDLKKEKQPKDIEITEEKPTEDINNTLKRHLILG